MKCTVTRKVGICSERGETSLALVGRIQISRSWSYLHLVVEDVTFDL
jgi:hypothetical protein